MAKQACKEAAPACRQHDADVGGVEVGQGLAGCRGSLHLLKQKPASKLDLILRMGALQTMIRGFGTMGH